MEFSPQAVAELGVDCSFQRHRAAAQPSGSAELEGKEEQWLCTSLRAAFLGSVTVLRGQLPMPAGLPGTDINTSTGRLANDLTASGGKRHSVCYDECHCDYDSDTNSCRFYLQI